MEDLHARLSDRQVEIGLVPVEQRPQGRHAHGARVGGRPVGGRDGGLGPVMEAHLVALPVVSCHVVVVRFVEQVVPADGVLVLQLGHDVPAVRGVPRERGGRGIEHRTGAAELEGRVLLGAGKHQRYPYPVRLGLLAHGAEQGDVSIVVVQPGIVLQPSAPGVAASDSHEVAVIVLQQGEVLMPEVLRRVVRDHRTAGIVRSVWRVEHRGPAPHPALAVDVGHDGELQRSGVVDAEELLRRHASVDQYVRPRHRHPAQ